MTRIASVALRCLAVVALISFAFVVVSRPDPSVARGIAEHQARLAADQARATDPRLQRPVPVLDDLPEPPNTSSIGNVHGAVWVPVCPPIVVKFPGTNIVSARYAHPNITCVAIMSNRLGGYGPRAPGFDEHPDDPDQIVVDSGIATRYHWMSQLPRYGDDDGWGFRWVVVPVALNWKTPPSVRVRRNGREVLAGVSVYELPQMSVETMGRKR